MSTPNSRIVTSNQTDLHESLAATVRKHLQHRFRKPYAPHNVAALEAIADWVEAHTGPLIFDSFCGVGESTAHIAQRFPEALVIGIDKSAHRLDKHQPLDTESNYRLVRADVDDFWRIALERGWRLSHHFLFYPNPWPKSSHLQRRVHGSPLFPTLLALGGEIELRSNWPLYPAEFAKALEIAGESPRVESFEATDPITPFERKYRDSGQPLWRCCCKLSTPPR